MTLRELQERQSWSLQQKIDHSLYTIENFLAGVDGMAYVAFSGGKDSTVLLDLVRVVDKDVPAVFCNTGNEWPEIVQFVRSLKATEGYNIVEVHPKKTCREYWAQFGFPLISKETANKLSYMKRSPDTQTAKVAMSEDSFYKCPKRWRFLAEQEFFCSARCCGALKHNPSEIYERKTGRHPITGTMAEESLTRQRAYLKKGGCNVFGSRAESTPLAIWTERDIWDYIRSRDLKVADIYYKGATRTRCVGCGFGAHLADDHRFDLLYKLYPKYYKMIMDYENNGVKYRDAIRLIFKKEGKKLPDDPKDNIPDWARHPFCKKP